MGQSVGSEQRAWLIGPWFDLLFLSNLTWPIIAWVSYRNLGFEGHAGIQFWQVYFITTPHRWITVLVVYSDRDRLRRNLILFPSLLALVVTATLFVRITTGTLTCLLTLDYLWNAWHFASQHHGIFRLYGRFERNKSPMWLCFEKVILRGYLLYVTARVATGAALDRELQPWLTTTDLCLPLAPLIVLMVEVAHLSHFNRARFVYLCSVLSLYSTMLWSIHTSQPRATLALTTASALFHATEYLAIMTWSVRQRAQQRGQEIGLLYWFANRWAMTLVVYLVVLGVIGKLFEEKWLEVWLTMNVIVAFLHYSYDGLIWRRSRKPVDANI